MLKARLKKIKRLEIEAIQLEKDSPHLYETMEISIYSHAKRHKKSFLSASLAVAFDAECGICRDWLIGIGYRMENESTSYFIKYERAL